MTTTTLQLEIVSPRSDMGVRESVKAAVESVLRRSGGERLTDCIIVRTEADEGERGNDD